MLNIGRVTKPMGKINGDTSLMKCPQNFAQIGRKIILGILNSINKYFVIF